MVLLGLGAVAAGPGLAKVVAGLAAAVAATNALIEVWRAERLLREPRTEATEWWRRRELSAKARGRVWTLLAGALTLAALVRDDGADAAHGAAVAAGVLMLAVGAVFVAAVRDAREQRERVAGGLGNRTTWASGALLVVLGLAALVFGSW